MQFDGGYAEASYVLTGETHKYNSATASYGGIVPANPFSLTEGGWGAWEIAGRVSTMNLNDQLATANGVAGGRQTVFTAGLNWYVNRNVRFMFDYLHGDVAKQISRDQQRRPMPASKVQRACDADPAFAFSGKPAIWLSSVTRRNRD